MGEGFPEAVPRFASDRLARFLALAKNGHPYEKEMVIEDVAGRSAIDPYAAALQYQRRDHMERSVEYARHTLDLGVEVARVTDGTATRDSPVRSPSWYSQFACPCDCLQRAGRVDWQATEVMLKHGTQGQDHDCKDGGGGWGYSAAAVGV
ncbi:MAG: hypothetical protein ACLQU1_27425 [Bryobacteraceae bacterium]